MLVGIFFAATGRGGELAYEQTDHAPVDLGPVSAADIALLRPPTAMWGYNMQVTDEALDNIARAMRGRDVTIAFLQEQLAALTRNGSYAEPRGAYARQDLAPGIPSFPEASESLEAADIAEAPETLESPQPRWAADIAEAPEILESPQPRWAADIAEAREALESPQAPWAARHRGGSRGRRYSRGRRSGGGSPGFRVPCDAPAPLRLRSPRRRLRALRLWRPPILRSLPRPLTILRPRWCSGLHRPRLLRPPNLRP